MIKTKLILIEVIAGSGKSTTAKYLADQIQRQGVLCQWFHELAEDNPIRLDFETASESYRRQMLGEWQSFVHNRLSNDSVTVLESRFWGNTALPIFRSVYSEEEVLQFNQQVRETIKPLYPVLIYFVHDDTQAALKRLYTMRGQEWVEWIVERDTQEPWFRLRGLSGFEGWLKGYEAWLQVADKLYSACEFPKLKVSNPHANWRQAYRELHTFLRVSGCMTNND